MSVTIAIPHELQLIMHPKICRVRRLIPRTHPLRLCVSDLPISGVQFFGLGSGPEYSTSTTPRKQKTHFRISPPIDLSLTTFNCARLQSHKASLSPFFFFFLHSCHLCHGVPRLAHHATGRRRFGSPLRSYAFSLDDDFSTGRRCQSGF